MNVGDDGACLNHRISNRTSKIMQKSDCRIVRVSPRNFLMNWLTANAYGEGRSWESSAADVVSDRHACRLIRERIGAPESRASSLAAGSSADRGLSNGRDRISSNVLRSRKMFGIHDISKWDRDRRRSNCDNDWQQRRQKSQNRRTQRNQLMRNCKERQRLKGSGIGTSEPA